MSYFNLHMRLHEEFVGAEDHARRLRDRNEVFALAIQAQACQQLCDTLFQAHESYQAEISKDDNVFGVMAAYRKMRGSEEALVGYLTGISVGLENKSALEIIKAIDDEAIERLLTK